MRQMLDQQLEKQVVNYNVGATTFTTSGTSDAVTQSIVQGFALNQRDGNAIVLRHLDYREVLNLTATINGAAVRTMIVLDTQNTGTVPVITEVLDNANPQSPYSQSHLVNKRFRFLYDKMHGMAVGGPTQEITVHWQHRKLIPVKYNGATNTQASNGRNAIFIYHITDLGVASPTYKFGLTMQYTDA